MSPREDFYLVLFQLPLLLFLYCFFVSFVACKLVSLIACLLDLLLPLGRHKLDPVEKVYPTFPLLYLLYFFTFIFSCFMVVDELTKIGHWRGKTTFSFLLTIV